MKLWQRAQKSLKIFRPASGLPGVAFGCAIATPPRASATAATSVAITQYRRRVTRATLTRFRSVLRPDVRSRHRRKARRGSERQAAIVSRLLKPRLRLALALILVVTLAVPVGAAWALKTPP